MARRRAAQKARRAVGTWIVRGTSLAAVAAAWEIASRAVANPVILPGLGATLSALAALLESARFWAALRESLSVAIQGLTLAVAAGIPVGVGMGFSPMLEHAIDPYVSVLNATPRVTFVPLIVLWLGLGAPSRVVLVFLLASLPIVVNTYAGMKNVDPEARELARSYCASRWQELADVSLPSAVPFVLTGVRLAAGYALSGVVTAELLISFAGLGGLLMEHMNLMSTAHVYALILVFATLGTAFATGARAIEQRLSRGWMDRTDAS
jgi:NitT/TauT family transport system permease protein